MKVKIHTTDDGRSVVAVCDSDVFGKCFEEGEFCLDLSTDFFDGEEMETDKISQLIEKAYVVSFAGCKAVDLGKKLDLVKRVNEIQDVPYAQVVRDDK